MIENDTTKEQENYERLKAVKEADATERMIQALAENPTASPFWKSLVNMSGAPDRKVTNKHKGEK